MTWRIESRQFVLPKEGTTLDECEDAVGVNDGARAYAVADGATEAFDARRWAVRLAEEWVRTEAAPVSAEEFGAWMAAQGEWLHGEWDGRALSWYAEEKRRAGSFAAFVGLRFEGAKGPLRWRGVALGDSCLVHLRGGSVLAALPLASHEQFNSSPPLVPSTEAMREAALARAVYAGGEAAPGDTFLLMSDAVAAWFFESRELRRRAELEAFDSLAAASDNEALGELLRRERREGHLKDDDVAVVRISIGGA